MAKTPESQHVPEPADRNPFADFNDPTGVLQRRQEALLMARQLQAENPTEANAALIRTLELDVAEHTPLDRPLEPPSSD